MIQLRALFRFLWSLCQDLALLNPWGRVGHPMWHDAFTSDDQVPAFGSPEKLSCWPARLYRRTPRSTVAGLHPQQTVRDSGLKRSQEPITDGVVAVRDDFAECGPTWDSRRCPTTRPGAMPSSALKGAYVSCSCEPLRPHRTGA